MIEKINKYISENPDLTSKVLSLWINDESYRLSKDKSCITSLSNIQKAAIFLISVGKENSIKLLKLLDSLEIDTVSFEIARQDFVLGETRNKVFSEFLYLLEEIEVYKGGIDYSRDILENAFGSNYAKDTICRLTSSIQVRPFDFIRRCEPNSVLTAIKQEHPQIIALVLSMLEPNKAAILLDNLSNDIKSEVAIRISTLGRVLPEVIREIERSLEKKLSNLAYDDIFYTGGVESLTEIINLLDQVSEKQIIESIEEEDPELADEIKRRRFVFEDIVILDDRAVQKIMREIDSQELAKALKGSDSEVSNKIFNNMSKRAADMLREDMEYMGPIREKDRDEAQLKILTIIRHLEDCGEILVPKPGQDCYVEESQVNPSYKEKDFNLISGFSDDHVLSALNYLNNAHEAIQSGDFDLDYIQSARYKSLICSPPLLFNKLTLDKNWFEKWKIKRRIKKSYIYDIVEILEARETISKYIKNFIPSNNSETKEKANG